MQDDKPPSYNSLSDPTIYRPDVMKTIEEQILLLDSELRELSLKIHGMSPSFKNNTSFENTRVADNMGRSSRTCFSGRVRTPVLKSISDTLLRYLQSQIRA